MQNPYFYIVLIIWGLNPIAIEFDLRI